MATPPDPKKNPLRHLRASDLRGAAQLATQATLGVTRIAEGVHQSVLNKLGASGGSEEGQARGVTGLVYKSVRGATALIGKGAEQLLAALEPMLQSKDGADASGPQRDAVLAALNGVMGDRLLEKNSPFATPMSLRFQGEVLNPAAGPAAQAVTGKVLLFVHGLCMNEHGWQHPAQAGHAEDPEVDFGQALAARLGYTPVYLRYNTGLHVSQNGHELAAQLEQLLRHWPGPVEELTIIAHSMGGLVSRSAHHAAVLAGCAWPGLLKNMVFLGTPHHGAPLERAGAWVNSALNQTPVIAPFTAPFARLAQLRSAGITDLRFGSVRGEDWQGFERHTQHADRRLVLPLPDGVACYTVAATLAPQRGRLADRLLGDGLVPLDSALGKHDDPLRSLVFAKPSQWIAYRMNHMELLGHPQVLAQLLSWLAPA